MSIQLDKYQDVINRLVSEAVKCSPETWKKGTLTIDCDGRTINYKLKNDEDGNKGEIGTALRKLCEELYVVMRRDGNVWTECSVNFFQTEEESWGMKIDFQYPNAPTSPPPLPAPSEKTARGELPGSSEARGGLIKDIEGLYQRIANGLRAQIPEEWTVAYIDAVFCPESSQYVGEYVSKADGRSKSSDGCRDASKAIRDMREKFAEEGKPLWGNFTFQMEPSGKFQAKWGYERCDANGDVIFEKGEESRRTRERHKRLT